MIQEPNPTRNRIRARTGEAAAVAKTEKHVRFQAAHDVVNYDNNTPDSTKTEGNEYCVAESFEDMNLPESLLRGIYSYGLEKPSTIQQKIFFPQCQAEI